MQQVGPYILKAAIGQGAFATVYMAQHSETNKCCVCKVVPRSRLADPSVSARFEKEMHINRRLNHPGVVQFYDLLSDDTNFYVVMELCPNGDLYEHILQNGHLQEYEAKVYFRQILEALAYLHAMGVSHRDIKLENLLVDQFGHVKISDFGLSNFMQNGLVETPCGSPCYVSPECLSGQPYDGATTDIWSAGVVLFAMVTGRLPWTQRNQIELFRQIRTGDYSVPEDLSPQCRDLIERLMQVDPIERITIEDALEHPWMRGVPQQFRSVVGRDLTMDLRSLSNNAIWRPKPQTRVMPVRTAVRSLDPAAGVSMEEAAGAVQQRRSTLPVRRGLVQPRIQSRFGARIPVKRPNVCKL